MGERPIFGCAWLSVQANTLKGLEVMKQIGLQIISGAIDESMAYQVRDEILANMGITKKRATKAAPQFVGLCSLFDVASQIIDKSKFTADRINRPNHLLAVH